MSNLVFAKSEAFDLLLGKCQNGHIEIFGFPHQLRGEVDLQKMELMTRMKCRKCDGEIVLCDKIRWADWVFDQGAGI